MTVTAWDMVDLDRLALDTSHVGNRPARDAFTAMALSRGWVWTPAWLIARDAFRTARRKHRADYMASIEIAA